MSPGRVTGSVEPEALASSNTRLRGIVGHLTTFLVAARTRNFHMAARELGKSQPVVTTQIQELEDLLGCPLFVRTSRTVYLTPQGQALVERAMPIVEQVRALVRDFRNQGELRSGSLRVSVSPTVAIGWMPALMKALAEAHPHLAISLREDHAASMFAAIATGDVSFGVGPFEEVPPGLVFTPLADQHFMLVTPQGHRLAGSRPIGIGRIEGEVLCAGVGTIARALVEDAFARAGRVLAPRHEAQNAQAVLGMVREGLGIAILPDMGSRIMAAQGLSARRIDDPALRRAIGLVEVRAIPRSAAAQEFVRYFPSEPA